MEAEGADVITRLFDEGNYRWLEHLVIIIIH